MTHARRAGGSRALWVAVAVTLGVTLLRLVGELLGWGPGFATTAGSPLAWCGIVWLIAPAGFWFGWELAAVAHGPRSLSGAVILPLVGLAVLVALVEFAVSGPTTDRFEQRIAWVWCLSPVLAAATWLAWPEACAVLAIYGVLARAPVVLIQWLAIAGDWGTHYEKVAPFYRPMSDVERGATLMVAQLTFWLSVTIMLGGLGAVAGAVVARRRRRFGDRASHAEERSAGSTS